MPRINKEIVKSVPPERQIVAVMWNGIITNRNEDVACAMVALSQGDKTVIPLDRRRMQFMSAADLGQRWDNLANGPTFFGLREDGSPCFVEGGKWKPKKRA